MVIRGLTRRLTVAAAIALNLVGPASAVPPSSSPPYAPTVAAPAYCIGNKAWANDIGIRKSLAQVANNFGSLRIAEIGDSKTMGEHDTGTTGIPGAFATSEPYYLAGQYTQAGFTSNHGAFLGGAGILTGNAAVKAWDTRRNNAGIWGWSASTSPGATVGLGGGSWYTNGTANRGELDPVEPFDTLQFGWLEQPSSTFSYDIDNGTQTSQNLNPGTYVAYAVGTKTVTGISRGVHTIGFTNTTGVTTTVPIVMTYDSTIAAIYVDQMGASGWGMAVGSNTASVFYSAQPLAELDAYTALAKASTKTNPLSGSGYAAVPTQVLWNFRFGVNDLIYGISGSNVSTVIANAVADLHLLAQRAVTDGAFMEITLVAPVYNNGNASDANVAAMNAAILAQAQADQVPVIDDFALEGGSGDAARASPAVYGGEYSGTNSAGLHENQAAYYSQAVLEYTCERSW